jgi:hypothetical protein
MITIRPAHIALTLLCSATLGCASAPLLVTKGPEAAAAPALSGLRFQVAHNDLSKKLRFRDLDAARMTVMRYNQATTTWGSPLNLLFDEDIYEKESHRIRYRFRHPFTGQAMALVAKGRSQRVANVQVRSEDALPVVLLFAGDEKEPRGTLRYDDHAQILFSGEIETRRIEIERVAPRIPPAANRGLLKHVLFSYPEEGEWIIRVDGQEAAWFAQQLQEGPVSPYALDLNGEADQDIRNDAMLAFVVFDLMKDFVNESY